MTSTINFSTSYGNKGTGANQSNTLTAEEWNDLMSDLNTMVGEIPTSSGSSEGSSIDSSFLYLNDKGNLCLETTAENTPADKKGKLNIESKDDLQLKPGDDFNLCAHHRGAGSTDQVLIKVLTETNDETEIPANIKINSGGNISLTNKDNIDAIMVKINPNYTKTKLDYDMVSDFVEGTFVNGGIYTSAQITSAFSGLTFTSANSNDVLADVLGAGVGKNRKIRVSNGDSTYSCYTFTKVTNADSITNINVEGPDGYGYLKVRAQAIDLRCEEHGGIALQPKGNDSNNQQNKIKFEHGGGDGLEFGTFNTEKTSIFTDEYRFNKEGVWKMATRTKEVSDKADENDETTAYKYVKQADDFYDIIALDDEQCTTKDIIKTAYAMNGGKDRHTKITNKGAIEIATNQTYTLNEISEPENTSGVINISTISTKIATILQNTDLASFNGMIFNDGDFDSTPSTSATYSDGSGSYFTFSLNAAPNIKIDSGAELKLGGILDFGSSFNFGETDNGIEVQYKLTKKNSTKDCGVLKVIGINNSTTNTLTITTANPSNGTVQDYVIPAAEQVISANTYTPQTIASCSINDIIMFVNWAKGTGFGPWSSEAIANKGELQWVGSGFAAVTPVTPGEGPVGE